MASRPHASRAIGRRRTDPLPAQQQQSEPAASRLSIDVSPRYIRLQPGEVVTASIKVRNMGPVVDEITLTPRGEAGAWITIAPDTLNIYPSTEAEATIRFAPPRASRPPAGLFAFEIAVNSDRQPDSSTVYRGSVELGSYDNLSAAATGTTYVTGRRDAILPIKVRNLGNRPTNVQVSAADLPGAPSCCRRRPSPSSRAVRRRCGPRSGPSPVSCLARRASFRSRFRVSSDYGRRPSPSTGGWSNWRASAASGSSRSRYWARCCSLSVAASSPMRSASASLARSGRHAHADVRRQLHSVANYWLLR